MRVDTTTYVCDVCGREKKCRPTGVELIDDLKLHIESGWVALNDKVYCTDCIPENLRPDPERKVLRFVDDWPNTISKECPETYDPYYPRVHRKLCRLCDNHRLNYEDDGSSWELCRDHNLYEGHFYGKAVDGRLCPYFTNELLPIGRDMDADIEAGTFEPPYNKLYDGD